MADRDAPPEKMRALVADGKGGSSVQSVPVPKLKDNEVLVKVDYVALVGYTPELRLWLPLAAAD